MAIANITRIDPGALRGFAIPLAILAAWEACARFHWINVVLLASPSLIAKAFAVYIGNGELWDNLSASLARMVLGWLSGVGVGLVLGAVIGLSRLGERLFGPVFNAFRQIAPFAWIPLISVWFGLGEGAKIAFIAVVALYPVVVNTFEGIRGTPKELVEVGRVLNFSLAQKLRRIVIPAATPSILSGLELAFLYSWLATIGAEYLLNSKGGLGALMDSAQERLEMDVVFLGVITSGLVGFSISLLARAARARLLAWRKPFN
jgi:sulfonate transport system permease protein